MAKRLGWALAVAALCGPAAWAADAKRHGAAAALFGAAVTFLVVGASLQVAAAVLAPRFCERAAQATRAHKLPAIAIGVGCGLAIMVVTVILSQAGGGVGKALAGLVLVTAAICAVPGMAGISRVVGDWATRTRYAGAETEAHPLVAVLVGAFVCGWASMLTGGALLIALLAFGLGAMLYAAARGTSLDVAQRRGSLKPPAPVAAAAPRGDAAPTSSMPGPLHDDGGQVF